MDPINASDIILEIKKLEVSFNTPRGNLRAVNGISYSVKKGEVMGIVGESGSGKSVGMYSILGLLKPPAQINAGHVLFEGKELLGLSNKALQSIRGNEISMIFQNPTAYLDPVFTIEQQMIETIRAHDQTMSKRTARTMSIQMLKEVRMRNPERVIRQYPFELSGGIDRKSTRLNSSH